MDDRIGKNILRSSGLCVVTGSVLLTAGYWTRPYIEKELVLDFAQSTALYSSILVAVGILVLLVGLPALFYDQARERNKPRFIVFALSYTGLAGFHLGTLALYFVLPVLATHSNETFNLIAQDVPPFPRFAIFWAICLLIQVAGLIIYSINMIKNTRYSRVATFAVLAGAILLIASPPINFRLLQPALTLVMAGFAGYGLTLISNKENRIKI